MTTQNNGSMTALEAGLEAVLFAAGDAVTIERLSAALEVAPAELLDAAAALENRYDFEMCIRDRLHGSTSCSTVCARRDCSGCRNRTEREWKHSLFSLRRHSTLCAAYAILIAEIQQQESRKYNDNSEL